jgi:type III secretion protein Q
VANQTANSQTEGPPLNELPVRLVFEVGRADFSLGEIAQLAPGTVVPLARPIEQGLDIVVNGRRIGSATLVRIGDSVGVTIARIFDLE